MLYFLLGPANVKFATSRNSGQLEISSEDSAHIMLEHPAGFISSIHLDYITRPTRRCFSIGGEKGIIRSGASGETRTLTLLPEPDFESGASTNSATEA